MDDEKSTGRAGKTTIGPKDRLSGLPVELLREIYELVCTGGSPPAAPLSRILLPYHRASKLKSVVVRSSAHIVELADLLEKRPERFLGPLVKRLQLRWSIETFDGVEVEHLCAALPRLSSLDLSDFYRPSILEAYLTSFFNACALTLSDLSAPILSEALEVNPATLFTLISSSCVSSLTLYPNLLSGCELASTIPPAALARIKNLTIAEFHNDHSAVATIVNECTALESLSRVGIEATDQITFIYLLPLLSPPSTLVSLSLFYDFDPEWIYPGDTVDHLLPRFSSLTTLSLSGGTFDKRTLHLVSGSSCHPSLKLLVINSVEAGSRGWSAKKEGRLHPCHVYDDYHDGPGWDVLEFDPENDSGGFTAGTIEILLSECAPGIRIEGTAIEAVSVY
ncbi:hypothetical protein JCM8547_009044 [Rhodosporidiobolus lusitaniae]